MDGRRRARRLPRRHLGPIRRWWGTQLYRDSAALGIEGFRTFEDRQKASDPNDAPQITYSFEIVAHDGSRYRVVAYREDADAAVGKARQWLSSGMDGEFVADAFGRGTFACVIGAGCIAGGLVGLLIGPKKR